MRKRVLFLTSIFSVVLIFGFLTSVFADESKQRVYDYANLLTDDEIAKLENLALKHGKEHEMDFIIVTTPDADGKSTKKYVQDFYDDMAFGFDKPHGNTVLLGMDMNERYVYIAGFYKGEKYIDDQRIDLIVDKITPNLSNENYYDAFVQYIETGSEYMGYMPGINPESFLLKTWFHLLLAIGVAGVIVGSMAYNSGGKVTVNERTYTGNFQVVGRKDTYLTTNVTKRRRPQNNSSGGGGGGGTTSGGHSHSGGGGRF
ncbi:TPM domain-containing protein [Paucisalibacillus globulus]|uniref:TPM domain-containing protein n=1 Tax=Paucisalibacillus globulus TaxID=351095 RepID=UPI00041A2465|nr:TPM domain-containing protein [Paucisalibacillus globulus]